MMKDNIIDSLGGIDDTMIEHVDALRNHNIGTYSDRKNTAGKKKKRSGRWLPIAASILLVACTALTAEATSGLVSNFFAPFWGVSRTEIIDDIGVPIDASVSADGYTLTADAVIGDRYNVMIVYTLTRDDGQPIPENIYFSKHGNNVLSGSSGIGGESIVKDAKTPNQAHVIQSWHRTAPLIGKYVTIRFSGLGTHDEKRQEYTTLAEGPWEVSFTLRHNDSMKDILVNRLQVMDEKGGKYQIDKVLLSPVGLHIEGLRFDLEHDKEPSATPDFKISIKLRDGTEALLGGCSIGEGNSTKNNHAVEFRYDTIFSEPVPLDEIEALVICDTEYPL